MVEFSLHAPGDMDTSFFNFSLDATPTDFVEEHINAVPLTFDSLDSQLANMRSSGTVETIFKCENTDGIDFRAVTLQLLDELKKGCSIGEVICVKMINSSNEIYRIFMCSGIEEYSVSPDFTVHLKMNIYCEG